MNTNPTPHQVPLRGQDLRTALGPGFQLASATDRLLREAAPRKA